MNADNKVSWTMAHENRLKTIATNAIEQARVTIGRGGTQWSDRETMSRELIVDLLVELPKADAFDGSYEHEPLAPETPPLADRLLSGVADALKNPRETEIRKVLTGADDHVAQAVFGVATQAMQARVRDLATE